MKKFLTSRTREDGFTLIELLVVVIIIAILAAIAVPVYIGIQNNAKKSGLQSDVATTKLNLAAALTEDGTIASGTYNTTGKSGDATVQNSGIGGDEVVTVVYNSDGTFTVSAKSAKLNYTAAADSKSGQQTSQTGPTAQDAVTIGNKILGTVPGDNGGNWLMLTAPAVGDASHWYNWQQSDNSSTIPTISSFPIFNGVTKYNQAFSNNYYLVGLYSASGADITHNTEFGNCYYVQPRIQYHYYTDGIAAGLNLSCNSDVLTKAQMDNIAKIVITDGTTPYTFNK